MVNDESTSIYESMTRQTWNLFNMAGALENYILAGELNRVGEYKKF